MYVYFAVVAVARFCEPRAKSGWKIRTRINFHLPSNINKLTTATATATASSKQQQQLPESPMKIETDLKFMSSRTHSSLLVYDARAES